MQAMNSVKLSDELNKEASGEMNQSKANIELGVDSDFECSDNESYGSRNDAVFEENGDSDSQAESEAIHWRIHFRQRNRLPFDTIVVDSTTPATEVPADPNALLKKDIDGHTIAKYFQFRHELKDSTYKNKYILLVDAYKMTFSERDDSILIRSDGDAIVHMGTANNTLFRNRNMAMEELRKILNLNLRVWKSLFISNREEQMGSMDLSMHINTVTAEHLTIVMDSVENITQILKIHRPVLQKFTLVSSDSFAELLEMEQVRNVPNLKLDGPSDITDKQLLGIKAINFEICSDKITCKGLKDFIKQRLSSDISDISFAHVKCNRGTFVPKDILEGLDYTEYKDENAYVAKNGSVPINVYEATFASLPTNKAGERLAVVINQYNFECFKEGKKPRLLAHDIIHVD